MTPVTGSSEPGMVTAQARAKASSDNRALSALLTTYGNLTAGTDGLALVADSTSPTGFSWAVSGAALLTTKGDLLTRNATDPVRLGVGTDGQVLVADSTQANGVKWGTNSPSVPQAKFRKSADQAISADVLTYITFDTSVYNTVGAGFQTDSSHFVVPTGMGGKWELLVWGEWGSSSAGNPLELLLEVDGTMYNQDLRIPMGGDQVPMRVNWQGILTDGQSIRAAVNQHLGTAPWKGGNNERYCNFVLTRTTA